MKGSNNYREAKCYACGGKIKLRWVAVPRPAQLCGHCKERRKKLAATKETE